MFVERNRLYPGCESDAPTLVVYQNHFKVNNESDGLTIVLRPLAVASGRTISTGRDGVPNRPEAQRLQAERPRPANLFAGNFGIPGAAGGAGGAGEGAGIGGLTGGQMHFQAGLGFFPSLFGLQFVSARGFCTIIHTSVCEYRIEVVCCSRSSIFGVKTSRG